MATLAELRADALVEADLQLGQVDDVDVDRHLNESLSELWELLVQSYEGVFSTEVTFTLDAGESTEDLPTDFYQATDLEDMSDVVSPVSMPTFEFKDRNRVWRKSWCIHGGQILVRPTEDAPGDYQFTYVPSFTALEEDDDEILIPNGWEQFAVIGAAIRLKNVQELSASGLEQRKEKMEERIRNGARKRTGPRKVRDSRTARITSDSRWRDWIFDS